ncbi:MAG: hypothetical protein ACODAD_08630, partial [Planctomycetota bacterium]
WGSCQKPVPKGPDPDRPDLPPGYDDVPFDYFNDDPVFANNPDAKERYAPQIYARHLYCLMMLLTEKVGTGGYVHPSEEATLSETDKQELTAHRIAQWAINVVDFRNANAIMTPFEYDVNPFNGWQENLDGDPSTNEGGDRRLVWGAEYPDLLLTEATAFHNRNVKDTEHDDGDGEKRKPEGEDPPGDDDLDQYRIPQGSLFVELYCTRNLPTNPRYPDPTNTSFPRELYDENGMLDLGRLAPPDPSGFRAPVWRVMISEPLNEADSPLSPLERSRRWTGEGKPDSTSFNPQPTGNPNTAYNMDLPSSLRGDPLPSPDEDQIERERYVWFAPQAPPTARDGWRTFFSRNFALGEDLGNDRQRQSAVKLAPGGYAVVGPRELTRVSAADDNDPDNHWVPSPQRLLMGGNTFRMIDNDGQDRYSPLLGPPNPIREPLGIICAAHVPSSWSHEGLAERGIGLNVSEPLPNDNYYEEPGHIFDTTVGVPDGYADPDPAQRTTDSFPDEPFDNVEGRPLADNNMQHTGTTLDYKAAFLQRLANPLEAYHPTRNPYVTVDWTTIDLTVYNGEDVREKSGYGEGDPFDPYDDPADDDDSNVRFATRQRGGRAEFPSDVPPPYGPFIANTPDYQLWSPQTREPFETEEIPNPIVDRESGDSLEHYFQYNLVHSLGYLNGTMGKPLGAEFVTTVNDEVGIDYTGAPQVPFPRLTWNNRPFANPLELMQVPASTASRLPHEFQVFRDWRDQQLAPDYPTDDPYGSVNRSEEKEDFFKFQGTFRHLLNFFHSSEIDESTNEPVTRGANFYRLFDYVETPSPFVGAERWYNPQVTRRADVPGAVMFRPPYNHLSRFQDPGRMNINTIFDPKVGEGLFKGDPAYDPTQGTGTEMFRRVFESRRGYASNTDVFELNSKYPTLFAAPFRSADSADLMPRNVPSSTEPGLPAMRKDLPVQATLLREDLINDRSEPLFTPDGTVNSAVLEPHRNQNRHSRFRYHSAARLSNLVGNNSNVFAVWITLGYFEVERNPESDTAPDGVDQAHPDGFRLGQELGTYSGDIKRHRAFYIIDRSIPVAFEPGQNNNVDHAILLRRFIE